MSQTLPSISKSASRMASWTFIFIWWYLYIVTFMPVREMYNISTRQGSDWGVEGYEVQKKHFDHMQIVKERGYEEVRKAGKATKDNRKVTKRGSFLDDEMIHHRNKPGP